MEIEYKWELPGEAVLADLLSDATVAPMLGDARELNMHATYYDTANQDVSRMHGGLRVRRENDESVCCLKLATGGTDGCKTRREFEMAADDVIEGLRNLPSVGAPVDVCEMLLAANPQPTCETDFVRREYRLEEGALWRPSPSTWARCAGKDTSLPYTNSSSSIFRVRAGRSTPSRDGCRRSSISRSSRSPAWRGAMAL